jgi:hypothetical protein
MEATFFLPVGRHVKVELTTAEIVQGELKGLINFGGIPAIWVVSSAQLQTRQLEHICLLNNVARMTVIKEVDPSAIKSTLILEP